MFGVKSGELGVNNAQEQGVVIKIGAAPNSELRSLN
jgi:hypothetical protein